jgi:AP-1 complex subunit gamma-1
VPDLLDHFVDRVETLLDDKNHGVLLTAVTLITELCNRSNEALNQFRKVSTATKEALAWRCTND